mmetsp:Transcript_68001/g.137885  ORF Transcript_68001/g.137885 Transcript_68001/m.137885 type:complete len:206 (+) Transcript_68001:1077-1694(+)
MACLCSSTRRPPWLRARSTRCPRSSARTRTRAAFSCRRCPSWSRARTSLPPPRTRRRPCTTSSSTTPPTRPRSRQPRRRCLWSIRQRTTPTNGTAAVLSSPTGSLAARTAVPRLLSRPTACPSTCTNSRTTWTGSSTRCSATTTPARSTSCLGTSGLPSCTGSTRRATTSCRQPWARTGHPWPPVALPMPTPAPLSGRCSTRRPS